MCVKFSLSRHQIGNLVFLFPLRHAARHSVVHHRICQAVVQARWIDPCCWYDGPPERNPIKTKGIFVLMRQSPFVSTGFILTGCLDGYVTAA